MCLHVNKVNNALQTCMSLWYFRWGSCLSWAGVVLDFFWWHPFYHDLGLGGQGGQHLGFLRWGGPVCILVIEFSFTEKLARIPGGGGNKVCGLTSGNGWTIFGGPTKGSTGVVWMTSFRVSCRVSLEYCRTWCPMGSSQREQFLL